MAKRKSSGQPPTKQEEQRFRQLADSSPQIVWTAMPDGTINFINRQWQEFTGLDLEQTNRLESVEAVIHPEDRAQVFERWARCLQTGEPHEAQWRFKRNSDGAYRWFLTRAVAVRDDSGVIREWIGTATDIEEQKRSEELIRQSEQRLRLATQTGKIGIWDWDIAANQVSWTDSLYEIHGVMREQFQGTAESFVELVHPEDRAAVSMAIQRALEHNEKYELEFRAIRPDGKIIYLFTNAVIVNENGKPVRMIGATADITASKEAENTLRESEVRFRTLTSHAPVGIFLTDNQGDCLFVNESWCKMAGMTAEQAGGKGWTRALHPADRERVAKEWYRSVESDVPFISEYRFLRADGSIRWLQGSAVASRNTSGEIIGYIGTISDITERTLAENATRSAQEQLQLITDTMDTAVAHCSADHRFIWVSRGYASRFGRVPHEIAGARIVDVLGEQAYNSIQPYIRKVLSGERTEYEVRIEYAKAGLRWMHVIYVPTFDASNQAVGWVAVVNDITERKNLEDALKEADRRKDEFLATLAHELRNPLAPIRNALQILRLERSNSRTAEQAQLIMERQIQHMVRLVDDLLDLSRVSRGKIELRKERADLVSVIQTALETSRPLIEQAGHQLEVHVPGKRLFVEADVTRLSQVFANLLNNAAKYTEKNGRIVVTIEEVGTEAVVSIQDNGIGIPAHMLSQVFEMFAQLDRFPEKSQSGLGIGLSIAKRLAEMHDGTIEVRSEGHGMGSEFIVRLPLLISESEEMADVLLENSDAGPALPGRRILVADDNEDSAISLATLLKIMGNEVRTARDGKEAVEVARVFRPEVILLDIGMPELNGFEACKLIRQETWGRTMMIVALTGWGQDDDKKRSEQAGFDHHIVKPPDPALLEKLLGSLPARHLTADTPETAS